MFVHTICTVESILKVDVAINRICIIQKLAKKMKILNLEEIDNGRNYNDQGTQKYS